MKNLLYLLLLSSCAAAPAYAQQQCPKREDVIKKLSDKPWEEEIVAQGITTKMDGVIEVWNNKDTGTFTITVTNPDNITCLVTAGQAFSINPPQPKGDDL